MNRNNVLVSVIINIGHDQPITPTQVNPRGRRLVYNVLAPTDVTTVFGACSRGRVTHGRLGNYLKRQQQYEAKNSDAYAISHEFTKISCGRMFGL
jgi:hypothetical protein